MAPTRSSRSAESALGAVKSSTALTPQTLVEHVAYVLSNKIFSYAPETFELDVAARHWAAERELNAHGFPTKVHELQARSGAGTLPLGYNLSKDFDAHLRALPQSIIATTGTLNTLRPALEQLTRRYNATSPIVAHVAALEYDGSAGGAFVADHLAALTLADELGLALVTSSSPHEMQHMALLSTLLANVVPTLHVYDGLQASRLNTKVSGIVESGALGEAYRDVAKTLSGAVLKRASPEAKVSRVLKALNARLRTSYQPFEYDGDDAAETVIVVLGSAQAAVAARAVRQFAESGVRAGVITVRIYRPFFEDAFLNLLPRSTRQIYVLGQVASTDDESDSNASSILYRDVLAAVSFAGYGIDAVVKDVKVARSELWDAHRLQNLLVKSASKTAPVDVDVAHYEIWDVDTSPLLESVENFTAITRHRELPHNAVNTAYNNTVLGGIAKVDVITSAQPLEAATGLGKAEAVIVGDERIFGEVDIVSRLKPKSALIVRLPDLKPDTLEKRLGRAPLPTILGQGIRLVVIDPSEVKAVEGPASEQILAELALASAIHPGFDVKTALTKLLRSRSLKIDDDTLAQFTAGLQQVVAPESWKELADNLSELPPADLPTNGFSSRVAISDDGFNTRYDVVAAKAFAFAEAYEQTAVLRPDLGVKTFTVTVKENRRLTPMSYDRNIFHIEFDLGASGLKYNIGEALGIHGLNHEPDVVEFMEQYGLNGDDIVEVPARETSDKLEKRTLFQALMHNIDIFGKPPKRFYEALSEYATDEKEKKQLAGLASPEGAAEFKRRAEVDTLTFADILLEFTSARLEISDIIKIVSPMKRREYSIASSQTVTPGSVALLIVVVNWKDSRNRDRWGQCSRYLSHLAPGTPVTVSVKPSVMKLPTRAEQPLIMAGLGTGLAPFRAFVQHRAWQKAQGENIGAVLLYMGSRHQREEYLYGEEWEAYQDAGVITLLGRAFSRDQPQKIYIQDRMRQTLDDIIKAYIEEDGSFYLCGPTWPVPDVTEVLEEAIKKDGANKGASKKVDSRKEIERLKEEGRYVLEVY